MDVQVLDDGTITIPRELVAGVGFVPGDKLVVVKEGACITVGRDTDTSSRGDDLAARRARIAKWIGFLGDDGLDGMSVDEYIEAARGR